jgi:hypothetical protein
MEVRLPKGVPLAYQKRVVRDVEPVLCMTTSCKLTYQP